MTGAADDPLAPKDSSPPRSAVKGRRRAPGGARASAAQTAQVKAQAQEAAARASAAKLSAARTTAARTAAAKAATERANAAKAEASLDAAREAAAKVAAVRASTPHSARPARKTAKKTVKRATVATAGTAAAAKRGAAKKVTAPESTATDVTATGVTVMESTAIAVTAERGAGDAAGDAAFAPKPGSVADSVESTAAPVDTADEPTAEPEDDATTQTKDPEIPPPLRAGPRDDEPVEDEPAETEPAGAEPAQAEPAQAEPVEAERAEVEPGAAERAEAEPAEAEPVAAERAGAEPAEAEPVEVEPGAFALAAESPAEHAQALVVRGLVKRFGDSVALAGVDLTVPAGSFYGIVGPNGAGKTTLLSIIAGLLRPDAGTVQISGIDQSASPRATKKALGVLPDRLRTFERLTGRQLLHYYGLLRGLPADVVEKRVADLARAFDLTSALSRVVSDYSAGMTKKIMLAGAMIHSPRVLVLDEPFESVDPVSSAVIIDILRAYVAHGGTVVLSNHGMELVEQVCARVAIIVGGEVLAEGTVDEVRAGQTLEQRFVELSGTSSEVEGLEWLHSFSG